MSTVPINRMALSVGDDQKMDSSASYPLHWKNAELDSDGGVELTSAHKRRLESIKVDMAPTSAIDYFVHVNENVARGVALLNAALAIFVIVCREHRWAWYVSILMFVDYSLRVLLGARGSVLGAMSEWVAHRLKPVWVPGAAKQFAGVCGAMFTGGAALCFFRESDTTRAGGAVLMGVLMGCALLEGLANVCVACVMYKLGLGMLDVSWLNEGTADATRDEYERTWLEEETPLHEPVPAVEVKLSNKQMGVDAGMAMNGGRELVYRYRGSTDAMKREQFNPIAQMRLHYFNVNLGLTGLALVFYYSAQPGAFDHPNYVWRTLAIAAGVAFGLSLILYMLRAVLHPRKLAREWVSPVTRPLFCAIPLNVLLFVPFAAEYAGNTGDVVFAQVLFWVSAPALLLLTIVMIALWITRPFDQDLSSPALFYPVLANVVAALMLPIVRADFVEGAWLFFSFSLFMWVVVTALTFTKFMHHTPLDDRARPAVTFLFANPLMLFLAYTNIQSYTQSAAGLAYVLDPAAYFLYYVGIVFFLVNVVLVLQAYYGRTRFDISYWGFSFPLCVLALASIQYLQLRNTGLTQGIATTAICIAAYVIAILAANTVTALLNKKMFVPYPEAAPSPLFLKLQHYALEECTASLSRQLRKGVFSAVQVALVQEQWTDFLALFEQHSSMEEVDLFPVLERIFPGCTALSEQQHVELHDKMASVSAAMAGLSSAHFAAGSEDDKRAACEQVAALTDSFLAVMVPHLEEEIANVTPVVRKHISTEQAKAMVRGAWHRVDIDLWRRAIPTCLRFQYNHTRRVRFLASLRAAIPDQMTTVAKIVFEGCDRLLYDRLCVDIPELRVRETAQGINNKVW